MFSLKMPIARSVFAAAVIVGCAATLSPSMADRIERAVTGAFDAAGATLSMISPSAGQHGLLLAPSSTQDSSGTPLALSDAAFGVASGSAQTQIGQMGRADVSGAAVTGAPVDAAFAGRATLNLDAEAAFIPATSLSVNLSIEVDMHHAVQQNLAHISVHSPPGETAVMTCGISNVNAPGATRDCSGRSSPEARALLSHKDGNNVTLTYDLHGAAGSADNNISIEVSYI